MTTSTDKNGVVHQAAFSGGTCGREFWKCACGAFFHDAYGETETPAYDRFVEHVNLAGRGVDHHTDTEEGVWEAIPKEREAKRSPWKYFDEIPARCYEGPMPATRRT